MIERVAAPRIGIIGTGAIGTFYGVMLARAGFDVHFLLRSEFQQVAAHGLLVDSLIHGRLILNPVQAYIAAQDMPPCDWLLVCTKALDDPRLLASIVGIAAPGASILLMQNGLEVEEQLRLALPDELHLLGGLCLNCAHRESPGVVVHQAMGGVNIAYHSGPATDERARRTVAAAATGLFHQAGLESAVIDDLRQARWQKLVLNISTNGLSVLLDCGTERMMADPDSRALVFGLMEEVAQAAATCGSPLPSGFIEQLMQMATAVPDYYPSMYHDYRCRRPMELEAIYARPLAAARRAGCDMPRTQTLLQALSFLESRQLSSKESP
ncbi:2-dehydropantoate 2-reductase [Pseudomonas agarici]|uniref:2-dehydropantoate 2-reductase n=1 Tax=Pseudomonas agarici TaxID=46677 RepID=A0A0X1T7H7_PSEAA|nr:putative 2-dehydropantoate 2-reductase [Pseudomonas agarici]AMB88036.1 2-dehydropantoate 2-reductase [Pseudomonas agarici]NWB92917.1 putative 2-dehydropantoate 2-reductase [Pseudomonas agarici]